MSRWFFFSSRRRHTSSLRDWSSDVCSSDLMRSGWRRLASTGTYTKKEEGHAYVDASLRQPLRMEMVMVLHTRSQLMNVGDEIGRASCREIVYTREEGGAGQYTETLP